MAAPVMASQSRAPPRVLMCSSKALDQRSQSDDLPVNASASMEYVVGGFETIVAFICSFRKCILGRQPLFPE